MFFYLLSFLIALALFTYAFCLIYIGLKGIFIGKVILLPAIYFFWFFFLLFLSVLLQSISYLDRQLSSEIVFSKLLMVFAFAIFLIFLWKQLKGYVVLGMKAKLLKDAIHNVLRESGLEFGQHQKNIISIKGVNAKIQIWPPIWFGLGLLTITPKSKRIILRKLVKEMKENLSKMQSQVNRKIYLLCIVTGALFAALGVVGLHHLWD